MSPPKWQRVRTVPNVPRAPFGVSLVRIESPYKRGLTRLHHRLAAEQTARNLAVIQRVAAASGLVAGTLAEKQEAPRVATPEASTDRTTLTEVPGGCSVKCA